MSGANKWAQWAFLGGAVALLSACSGQEHADLRDWVQTKRSEARPRITPLAVPKVFVPQAYLGAEALSPFSPEKLSYALHRDVGATPSNMALLATERSRRKEDLENYPLDTMSMVGSLHQNGRDIALLRVNQLIYQVGVGNYIGQNYGRIVKIDEYSVHLREIVQDAGGDWVEKMTTLNLQEGK